MGQAEVSLAGSASAGEADRLPILDKHDGKHLSAAEHLAVQNSTHSTGSDPAAGPSGRYAVADLPAASSGNNSSANRDQHGHAPVHEAGKGMASEQHAQAEGQLKAKQACELDSGQPPGLKGNRGSSLRTRHQDSLLGAAAAVQPAQHEVESSTARGRRKQVKRGGQRSSLPTRQDAAVLEQTGNGIQSGLTTGDQHGPHQGHEPMLGSPVKGKRTHKGKPAASSPRLPAVGTAHGSLSKGGLWQQPAQPPKPKNGMWSAGCALISDFAILSGSCMSQL